MAKLRICSNNLVELGNLVSSIVASTQVATLPASNLLNSVKSNPWRSTTKASEQTLTIVFHTAQQVSMIAAMFTNLSATATLKAYLYTLAGDVSPVFTSPDTPVFTDAIVGNSAPALQNTYSYGAGSHGVIYFTERTVEKIVLGITDTANAASYLQIGNLVTGKYWSPVLNFERGETVHIIDDSKHYRTDSGDLLSDVGVRYRKLGFKLSNMRASDRIECINLLRTNSITSPIFVSLFPDDIDPSRESLYCVQGCLEGTNPLDNPIFDRYSLPLSVIEL